MNSLIRVGSRRRCQCSGSLPPQSCSERQPLVVDGRRSAQPSAAVPETRTRPAKSRLPTWISPDASGGRSGTRRNSPGSVESPYAPVTYGTVMVLLINLPRLVLTTAAKPALESRWKSGLLSVRKRQVSARCSLFLPLSKCGGCATRHQFQQEAVNTGLRKLFCKNQGFLHCAEFLQWWV